jgi:hypothetical protein
MPPRLPSLSRLQKISEETLGLGFVAQKQGVPMPLQTNYPNVEIRMQLIQHRNPGMLQKILFE